MLGAPAWVRLRGETCGLSCLVSAEVTSFSHLRTRQSRMLCALGVPLSMYDLFHYFEILVTFWTRGPPSASCLCCIHDKQGQGQQSGRHTDHHPLKVAGLRSSSRKIIEDAKEGSPRRPGYCRFLPGTALPTAAMSQKQESNFGDALKHRADRTF